MPRGIFVTHRGFLTGMGGVQSATREYIDVIAAAGVSLDLCPFEHDRRVSTRVLRRLLPSPYFRPAEPSLPQTVASMVRERSAGFVFLNQVALGVLAPALQALLPGTCRIVLLSHGLESTDLRHRIRAARTLPLSGHTGLAASLTLNLAVRTEQSFSTRVGTIGTLSPQDAELGRQMGATHVDWLPRIVRPAPLDWQPTGTRLGFLGTLDHAPNMEGLVAVLDRFGASAAAPRIRVVGGPTAIGTWLTRRYPCVDYVGPLDDHALRQEASGWNAFLHPMFYLARGCSTKLATGLAWQIPVVTTVLGLRGYVWREGGPVIADTPDTFVAASLQMLDRQAASEARTRVMAASASTPTLADNALRMRRLLGLTGAGDDEPSH